MQQYIVTAQRRTPDGYWRTMRESHTTWANALEGWHAHQAAGVWERVILEARNTTQATRALLSHADLPLFAPREA